MDTSPIGLKKNWVTDAGGLPLYIRAVAHAFIRKGVPESMAIQRAVGVVQDWARGCDGKGGHVTPATMAKAAAAVADWEKLKAKAKAHAHANDSPAIDLAGTFTEQLHPRVPAGQGGGGRFGSKGGPLTAKARARSTPVTAPVHAPMTGASLTQAQQLRYQASQDRHLARQVLVKVASLQRIRAGYIAGKLTAAGAPVKPVSAAASAAAKKAAATRKAAPGAAAKASAAAKKGASTKKATVARMTRQIRTLKGDARALLSAANHLDAQAAAL